MCRATATAVTMCLLVVFAPRSAHAFSTLSSLANGCHEIMMHGAWSATRPAFASFEVAVPDTRSWRGVSTQLLTELELSVPADDTDHYVLFSLLTGVRAPDTEGHSFFDLKSLRSAHEARTVQFQHCLRRRGDDYEDGESEALEGCRQEIYRQLELGRAALSRPLSEQNIQVSFALDFYGEVDVWVWEPGYRFGRAAHAVQDGFSHHVRSADLRRVHSVMNFVDPARDEYRASRDGLAHSTHADTCHATGRADEIIDTAATASARILVAAIDSAQPATPDDPQDPPPPAVEAAVLRWFELRPGCTAANDYCQSPWLPRMKKEPTKPLVEELATCGCASLRRDGESRAPLNRLLVAIVLVAALALFRSLARRSP